MMFYPNKALYFGPLPHKIEFFKKNTEAGISRNEKPKCENVCDFPLKIRLRHIFLATSVNFMPRKWKFYRSNLLVQGL